MYSFFKKKTCTIPSLSSISTIYMLILRLYCHKNLNQPHLLLEPHLLKTYLNGDKILQAYFEENLKPMSVSIFFVLFGSRRINLAEWRSKQADSGVAFSGIPAYGEKLLTYTFIFNTLKYNITIIKSIAAYNIQSKS